MSMLIDAEIVNAIVLPAVLEADLGLHARLNTGPGAVRSLSSNHNHRSACIDSRQAELPYSRG